MIGYLFDIKNNCLLKMNKKDEIEYNKHSTAF